MGKEEEFNGVLYTYTSNKDKNFEQETPVFLGGTSLLYEPNIRDEERKHRFDLLGHMLKHMVKVGYTVVTPLPQDYNEVLTNIKTGWTVHHVYSLIDYNLNTLDVNFMLAPSDYLGSLYLAKEIDLLTKVNIMCLPELTALANQPTYVDISDGKETNYNLPSHSITLTVEQNEVKGLKYEGLVDFQFISNRLEEEGYTVPFSKVQQGDFKVKLVVVMYPYTPSIELSREVSKGEDYKKRLKVALNSFISSTVKTSNTSIYTNNEVPFVLAETIMVEYDSTNSKKVPVNFY